MVDAHNTLRKITLHLKEKQDQDLMEFFREKMKIQNQLVGSVHQMFLSLLLRKVIITRTFIYGITAHPTPIDA